LAWAAGVFLPGLLSTQNVRSAIVIQHAGNTILPGSAAGAGTISRALLRRLRIQDSDWPGGKAV